MTIDVPAFAGASGYRLSSPYISIPVAPPTTTLRGFEHALSAGNLVGVLEAHDVQQNVVAYAQFNAPLVPGGQVSPTWNTATRARTIAIHGGASGTDVAVTPNLMDGDVTIASWKGSSGTSDLNGQVVLSHTVPAATTELVDEISTGGSGLEISKRVRVAAVNASYTMDFVHTAALVEIIDVGDGRPTFRWQRDSALASADYVRIWIEWGTSERSHAIDVIVPAALTSFRLPAPLPGQRYVAGIEPPGAIEWDITYVDASWLDGYETFLLSHRPDVRKLGDSITSTNAF